MITVFIEAATGSREKDSYNEETLEYRGMGETLLPYPYPYGFITGTRTPEGDELDYKVLATIPGEDTPIDEALRLRLEAFIYGIFAHFPEVSVRVGKIRSEEEALAFIERWRLPGWPGRGENQRDSTPLPIEVW